MKPFWLAFLIWLGLTLLFASIGFFAFEWIYKYYNLQLDVLGGLLIGVLIGCVAMLASGAITIFGVERY